MVDPTEESRDGVTPSEETSLMPSTALKTTSLHTRQFAWEEFFSLLKSGIPLIANAYVQYFPSMLTSMMLGKVADSDQSAKIIAANTLAGLVQVITIFSFTDGVSTALQTLLAQSLGAKQLAQFCVYLQAGALTMVVLLLLAVVTTISTPSILKWLGQDPDLADLAGIFAVIILATTPFTMINSITELALVAQRRTNALFVATVVSNAVSLPVAYWLGFHTSLAFIGVTIAQTLGSAAQSVVQLYALLGSEAIVNGWPGWRVAEAWDLLVRTLPLAGSSTLMKIFMSVGLEGVSFLSGLLPNAAQSIATSNIAIAVIVIGFFPGGGFAPVGMVGIAAALGDGNVTRAKTSSRVLAATMLAASALSGLAVSFIVTPYAQSSTSDMEVVNAAVTVFFSLLVLIPLEAWKSWCQTNMIACAKQWLVAKLSFFFFFVVGVPLGWLFASTYQWGVLGLWYGQIVGLLGFGVVGTIWFHTFDWHQAVTDAQTATHHHDHHDPQSHA